MAGNDQNFKDPNINWPRTRSLTTIGLVGLLMLISHQNCAPASGSSPSGQTATVATGGDSQPIQINDGYTGSLAVSFASPRTQLDIQGGVAVVQGTCAANQDGSVLDWKLLALNPDGTQGAQIFSGYATCSAGSFSVELTEASQLTCGESYQLNAQFGFVQPAITDVSIPCTN